MTTAVMSMTDADYTPRPSVEAGLVHDYLKRELADPNLKLLIPRCQEGELYPDRQTRAELVRQTPPHRGSMPVCRGCVACRRRDQSEYR